MPAPSIDARGLILAAHADGDPELAEWLAGLAKDDPERLNQILAGPAESPPARANEPVSQPNPLDPPA